MRDVVVGGRKLNELDDQTVFLWTAKIFFGVLYRELSLPVQRADPNSESIVSVEAIRGFRMLHAFLQACRYDVRFECIHARFPATIYLFKLQEPETVAAQFDFRDSVIGGAVYLRMGRVGVIAVFDTGAQAFEWGRLFPKYQRYWLHPVQFEELGAAAFYKASLFDRVPKLLVSGSRRKGFNVFVLPLAGMSGRPVFLPWDTALFAEYLAEFTGMPVEHLLPNGSNVMTFMRRDANARFRSMSMRENGYRGLP